MTDFGWNYPPGAAHDPRAPWNIPDAEQCQECEGKGWFWICSKCRERFSTSRTGSFPFAHLAMHSDPDNKNYRERCDECEGAGETWYDPSDHPRRCRCRECDPDYYNDVREDR